VHSPVVVFTLLLVVFANTAVAERMEKRKIRTTADTGRSPLLDIDETPPGRKTRIPAMMLERLALGAGGLRPLILLSCR
jgi:hypothetical protein